MGKVLTIGEAMGLLVAESEGPLDQVKHFERHVCGAELNYIVGMARLGFDAYYVSRVGNDPFGTCICNFLRENHIHDTYVQVDDAYMTGFQMKEKVSSGDPKVANIRRNTAFTHLTAADFTGIDWQGVQLLHVTGIPLALSDNCRQAIAFLMEEAHQNGVPVSFDTNLRPMLWPDEQTMCGTIRDFSLKADIVLPGLSEARRITGLSDEKAVGRFYLDHGVKTVAVKLGGSDGVYVCTAEEEHYVPSYHVDHIVDTVGAGDGFAAGFTSGLLDGLSLYDAARRGAAIGALQIQVAGDNEGLPTRSQLQEFQERAE
ncbi:sugar kinase [uncultured Megasphaera sp.]|jgi:2-dehydro-3-deoxygluconokinase|uniref:sugar kinase n=1 Tax=uncultured Megasphaera sp. TaxID=165188 RepID=UPI0025E64822|nr:sugar kinase [uncultured Megasphaera sp.]